MTTDTDRTWAVRIEAKGIEPVVQGPFTLEQADALLAVYLDADREDTWEYHDGLSRRRITREPFDPADRDLSKVIPEGEERFSWPLTIFSTSLAVLAVYFAFHTYRLQFVTPHANDAVLAVLLAFSGVFFLFLIVTDALSRAWSGVLAHWTSSSRRKQQPAEVAS